MTTINLFLFVLLVRYPTSVLCSMFYRYRAFQQLKCFSCLHQPVPQYKIVVTDDIISIPIPEDVHTDRVSFDVYGGEIVFKNGYDLCFYDYKTHTTRIDTFLISFDYSIRDYYSIFGSYPSGLVLDDRQNLIIYNIPERKLDFIEHEKEINENSTEKFHVSGSSYGWSGRVLDKYVVSTNLSRYIPGRDSFQFYLSVFDLLHQNDEIIAIDFPKDILNTNYKFSKVMRTEIIEEDLSGNGINISFMYSCKTFNINHDGTTRKYELTSRHCDCGLNDSNVEAVISEWKLPSDILPTYGNLFKDKYRGYYYQLESCKKYLEAKSRTTFLRILNEEYETLAETELDPSELRGRFICLPEGLFVRTTSSKESMEEKSVTFKKLKYVKT